jgi:hypothetical protein
MVRHRQRSNIVIVSKHGFIETVDTSRTRPLRHELGIPPEVIVETRLRDRGPNVAYENRIK